MTEILLLLWFADDELENKWKVLLAICYLTFALAGYWLARRVF